MLRTNNRCVVWLNISVDVAKCGKYSQIHPVHSLFVCYIEWLVLLNNLFMVSFQLIRMLSYAKNKHQMCWVNQHQCRSRQMLKIFTNSPSTLTFCLLQKNDYPCLNNLFMVSIQLISISSSAKNKLQMCWVTQHQCRSRQMWKIFRNSHSTLTFWL